MTFHGIDSGQGKPILFVHGFPLDHAMWSAQTSVLGDTYRVIAPDLRGFGKNSTDPSVSIITMEQFADDLAELLDRRRVSEPIVLCGLSMGGYVAWQFWRRHARRLAGLILCDTRAAADTPEVAAARQQTALRVEAEGTATLVDAMPPKLLAAKTRVEHPETLTAIERMIRDAPPTGVAAAARGMARRVDATSWLAQIECPTLAIVGSEDALTPPEEMRRMAESIPNARFAEIPDAGHLSPMENPQAVNHRIREFLEENKGSGYFL